jgi:hypothetical protein
MHPAGLLMIHAPWMGAAAGNAEELRQQADALDKVSEAMLTAYRRSGQPDAVIRGWLDGKDHWFTADEALALGLVTEIVPEAQAPAPEFANAAAPRHRPPPEFARKIQAMSTPTYTDPAAVLAADRKRRGDIRAKLAPWAGRMDATEHATLLRECEDDPRCTPEAAGVRLLEVLGRNSSPVQGSAIDRAFGLGTEGRVQDFRAAATDCLLMRAGLRVAQPHPAARDLAGMGIVAMAEAVLSMTGQRPIGTGRDAIIRAALSTSDFPALLGNVANKSLQTGFVQANTTHREWTAPRTVGNFKPQTLVNLSNAPGLLPVPEHAEYRAGNLTDSATTFSVSTFGRIIRLSRQALVNDDTGAFTTLPAAMGAAAARLEADETYARLLATANLSDGQPLFHSSRGNVGSIAALSGASLMAARAAMRRHRTADGLEFMDLMPAVLLVPVSLEGLAEQLVTSPVDITRANATVQPEWIRRLRVVADPRLDVSSTTTWFLVAQPEQAPGIVRAYLEGQEQPFLESQEGFTIDAIEWKVRLDFGTGVIEPKSLYRTPGA